MKIKKIKINNYKLFNDFELKFNKPKYEYYKNINLSVLVGENGTGKTTLLKSIAEKFCPESFENGNGNNGKVKIEYEIENEIYSTNSDSQKLFPKKVITSSYTVFDKHEPIPKWILDKKNYSIKTRYCYCAPNENKYGSFDMVLEYIIKVLAQENEIKSKFLFELMERIGYNDILYIEINHKICKDSINRERRKLTNNGANYNRKYNITDEDKKEGLKILEFLETNYLGKIKEIKKEAGNKGKLNGSIKVPINYFLEELYEGYIVALSNDIRDGVKDIYIGNEFQEEIKLSEMSSGEITMLFRFLPLIFEVENNSIIVIDEPETHLHPKWIAEFIDYLVGFLGEFKIHVIIATHSPKIISDIPRECIIGLKKEKDEIKQYMPNDRTLGAGSTELLKNVFEINEMSSKFIIKTRDKITQIFSKEILNEKEIMEAIKIYNDLGTNLEKYEIYKKYKHILEKTYVED